MDPGIPSVTTLQCVNALMTLGFEIGDFDDRVITLVGAGGARVFVRRHCTLSPNETLAILMVAGVSVEDFVLAIARRGSRTSPRDALGATSGVRDRDAVLAEVDRLLEKRSR